MQDPVNVEEIFGTDVNDRYSLCNLIEGRYEELNNNDNEPLILRPPPYCENDAFVEIISNKKSPFNIFLV